MNNTLNYIVLAEDIFASLSKESEHLDNRIIEFKDNYELKLIIDNFEKFVEYNLIENVIPFSFRDLKSYIPEIINSRNIEKFCLFLPRYRDIKDINIYAGNFISQLILSSNEREFNLPIVKSMFLTDIGNELNSNKIININGDIGSYLGNQMQDGKIILNGNCWRNAGNFGKGGEIHIYGNTGDYLANYNNKTKIFLYGDTGNYAGHGMLGGEVHIFGEYGHISKNIHDGNIYHKGIPLILNGKKVAGANIKWQE